MALYQNLDHELHTILCNMHRNGIMVVKIGITLKYYFKGN